MSMYSPNYPTSARCVGGPYHGKTVSLHGDRQFRVAAPKNTIDYVGVGMDPMSAPEIDEFVYVIDKMVDNKGPGTYAEYVLVPRNMHPSEAIRLWKTMRR